MLFRIPTEMPQWGDDQAAALRQFLGSPAGQAFLQRLFWQRPSLPVPAPGTPIDPATRAIAAEHLAGYDHCIDDLIQLTQPLAR